MNITSSYKKRLVKQNYANEGEVVMTSAPPEKQKVAHIPTHSTL